tara:strand:- start:21 stop:617 length:597 start_codon:yes stop_codon:yes gene_type:complete
MVPDNFIVSNYAFSKRKKIFDLSCAFLLAVILIFIMPIVWILMMFVDKGPLLFLQTRVGYEGRNFTLIKIRSLKNKNESSSDDFNDISLLGEIIRKLHIDEFPQAFNVMKGDMSFVGPRPYVVEECVTNALGNDQFNLRNLVKPGITGLAQIEYQHENIEQTARKLELDLDYISNCSFRMDIYILWATLLDSLMGKGT